MKIIRTVSELKSALAEARSHGTVGLVPTMGALHDGHLSLVAKARAAKDTVVVSVFVNPTQFNNPADLATYPRTEEADCRLLEGAGADIAFIPTVDEMYPQEDTRVFDLGPVADVMEGPMRPGHFNGVAQVVSKLFDFTRPTRAYFGEKDFQQIAVIRRMVELQGGYDGLEIVSCPIKRHSDGLAMSSRNVRLSSEQREVAPCISLTLKASVNMARERSLEETRRWVTDTIDRFPFMKVEYYEIVDGLTMQPVKNWEDTEYCVGCITAYCGEVRLIDNITYFNHTTSDAK